MWQNSYVSMMRVQTGELEGPYLGLKCLNEQP